MDVRKSQQVVKFDPSGGGWAVRMSANADSPPPHLARGPTSSRWLAPPPPLRPTTSPPLQRSATAPALPPAPATRRPLAPIVNANERALCAEIRMLEQQVKKLSHVCIATQKINAALCAQLARP